LNHIGKKYHGTDTIPYKCYCYYFSNRPNEEEISEDCEGKYKWHDIIVFELKNRRRYYKKEKRVIEYNPINRIADPSDKESTLSKFIYND